VAVAIARFWIKSLLLASQQKTLTHTFAKYFKALELLRFSSGYGSVILQLAAYHLIHYDTKYIITIQKIIVTRAKEVLPNIDRTQAAVSVHSRHPVTPDCDGMVPPAAGGRHLQRTAYTTLYNALSMGRKTPVW